MNQTSYELPPQLSFGTVRAVRLQQFDLLQLLGIVSLQEHWVLQELRHCGPRLGVYIQHGTYKFHKFRRCTSGHQVH